MKPANAAFALLHRNGDINDNDIIWRKNRWEPVWWPFASAFIVCDAKLHLLPPLLYMEYNINGLKVLAPQLLYKNQFTMCIFKVS